MPLKETDHELTSAEIFAVRLFGVLESIVLLQFIALEECMLYSPEKRARAVHQNFLTAYQAVLHITL